MRYLFSEGEKQYMDIYHGQFSKKLAEFAIDNMYYKEKGVMKKLQAVPLETVEKILNEQIGGVPDNQIYTAWYLYNMTLADNQESLPTDEARAEYIDETINDPDGCPESVLACYRAKMDLKGVAIMWERYI